MRVSPLQREVPSLSVSHPIVVSIKSTVNFSQFHLSASSLKTSQSSRGFSESEDAKLLQLCITRLEPQEILDSASCRPFLTRVPYSRASSVVQPSRQVEGGECARETASLTYAGTVQPGTSVGLNTYYGLEAALSGKSEEQGLREANES